MIVHNTKKDFPLLMHYDQELVYFDNASTSHKPSAVLDAMTQLYTHDYANVHRGIYALAEQATQQYEESRATVAQFISASAPDTVVFTQGTTDSINCVAWGWARHMLKPGDEIVIPQAEHHANIIPWQQLERECGIKVVYIPVTQNGMIDYQQSAALFTHRTKLLTVSQVSHVTGVHHDIEQLVAYAHAVGARVLLDAAQSVPHQRVNVEQLQVDFCAFSAHKMCGPTGIGALYIKPDRHDEFRPYRTGGGMVHSVQWHTAQFLKVPHLLEAGTPPIAEAIGFAAACRYLRTVDMCWLQEHEARLCSSFIDGLLTLEKCSIIGPLDQLRNRGHIVTFAIRGSHAHDVAAYLSHHGICVRAGHHCAQPFAALLGLDATVRASFYLYNTIEEVAYCLEVIKKLAQ